MILKMLCVGKEMGEEGWKDLPKPGRKGLGLGVGKTPFSCFLGLWDSEEPKRLLWPSPEGDLKPV